MSERTATRLSLLCERIIEAGWLAALVSTPLFFNVYSNRIFEPDKAAVLRCIVLVMGLAWAVRGLEQWAASRHARGRAGRSLMRSTGRRLRHALSTVPLLALALLFLADYALATALSVAPRSSLWGSYARLQGLYTTAAYVGVFLSLLALLRTRDQLERLITAVLVVSLPVSLYGIIQHFGTDPLPWTGDVIRRVASSMGNPIFVAAFLILTVPLTLYRLFVAGGRAAAGEGPGTKRVLVIGSLVSLAFQMAAWQAGPGAGTASAVITAGTWLAVSALLQKPLLPFVHLGSYTVLLAAQLMCILFSQSRGPWLGLLAGLFFFALLWTLARRQWRRASLVATGGVAVVLLLAVINLPASPLGFVRGVPYVGRLGQLFETDAGSARVRVLIWEGVERLVAADPLRSIVGYGPETLHLVYPPHYPPALGRVERRDALPDRAHNETFDVLATTGLLGLVIYLLLFTSLFYYGLQWMGVLRTPAQRTFFLGAWLAGGGAVLLFRLIDGSWRFAGVSLPVGMIGGLFVYLCGYGLLAKKDGQAEPADLPLRLMVVTLLSALVAHFVEINLGIALVATRTYFWSYAALMVVCGYLHRRRPGLWKDAATALQPGSDAASGSLVSGHGHPAGRRLSWRPLIASGLVVGLIMITLVYAFLNARTGPAQAPSILWLLGFTWAWAGLIVITEAWPAGLSMRNPSRWPGALEHRSGKSDRASWSAGEAYARRDDDAMPAHRGGVATPQMRFRRPRGDGRSYLIGALGVFAAVTLAVTVLFGTIHWGVLRFGDDGAGVLLPYLGAVLLLIVAMGRVLIQGEPRPARTWGRGLGPVYLILAAGVLAAADVTNVDVMRADVYFKQAASHLHPHGRYDEAVARYRRALALAPKQDAYHLFLGKTLLQRAGQAADPEALLREAEGVLLQAQALAPLNPDHTANLARLYRFWALRTENAAERTDRLRKALAAFEGATLLSPNTAYLWNELGAAYLAMGDTTGALATYRRSLSLDDAFYQTHILLGHLYRAQQAWKEAAHAYEQAVALEPRLPEIRLALAYVRAQMERPADGPTPSN